jgi:hypothetical protein
MIYKGVLCIPCTVDSLSAIITIYGKIYELLIKVEGKSSGDAK